MPYKHTGSNICYLSGIFWRSFYAYTYDFLNLGADLYLYKNHISQCMGKMIVWNFNGAFLNFVQMSCPLLKYVYLNGVEFVSILDKPYHQRIVWRIK